MKAILVTGMSGTGKSTLLRELGARGHRVVDTDTDAWSRWVTLSDGSRDWIWRDPEIGHVLAEPRDRHLFLAGCKSNQGIFYPQLDEVVLLSAPADVLFDRIARRDDTRTGKTPAERALVLDHLATVEPLLRRTCSYELAATAPVDTLVAQLEQIAANAG